MCDKGERQTEEKYKALLSLWASENQVKTNKLQMLALITSILFTVFVFVGGTLEPYVCGVGIGFSLIWLFSIGRTLHYQAFWRHQIDDIHSQFGGNPLFDIFDQKSMHEFKTNIAGAVSSTYILLAVPVGAAIMWLIALLLVEF